MSIFERENASTIEELWAEYHRARQHTTSKVLSTAQYMQLLSKAQAAPMFLLPVPKGEDSNSYFMLVCQNQQKSFVLTYLEDFKRNPLTANPYLVLTCFDELVRGKGLALLRGDVISHMSRNEGATIMEQVLQSYLHDSEYETVRKFNFEPQSFDFEAHT